MIRFVTPTFIFAANFILVLLRLLLFFLLFFSFWLLSFRISCSLPFLFFFFFFCHFFPILRIPLLIKYKTGSQVLFDCNKTKIRIFNWFKKKRANASEKAFETNYLDLFMKQKVIEKKMKKSVFDQLTVGLYSHSSENPFHWFLILFVAKRNV